MHHDFYVLGFSSLEDGPDALRYSMMKFGHDESAREIGYEMADGLFERHSDLLLANSVVVIPSPYNYVKNAATVVTGHMIDRLNHLMVAANGTHVDYSIIHRKVSYIADYGFLPKSQREKLLSNDRFFLNRKFLKGKLLIFVDDIKITGTHEEKLKEILLKERLDNDVIFAYSAKYYGNSPEIESQLNGAAIRDVNDYVDLSKTPNHHLLVRPVKFLLKQDFEDFNRYLDQTPLDKRKGLYYACLGEGYTIIPDYQENISHLKGIIDV